MKDPQENKDKGIVYRIPCGDCSEVYIGETGRPLKTRITEHKRAVNQMDTKNANAKLRCVEPQNKLGQVKSD